MKVLMVCLGNICRSPMAEGILRRKIEEQGLQWKVDSAGTGNWHVGESPHQDSIREASKHHIDITGQRARQLEKSDFEYFDLILVMDDQNLNNALQLAETHQKQKVKKLLSFHPDDTLDNVPDPYFEGGFDAVFTMIEEACSVLVETYKT